MGVYIPNMKMPRNCVDCEIERFADCGIWQGVSASDYIDKRYEHCPLIEEKIGKWIYDDEAYPGGNPYGHYDCDQCGESVRDKTNYCPNCGAKMEVK